MQKETRCEMVCTFAGMMSITSNSKSWYGITYVESETLQLHNFVKNDQKPTNICTRLFLYIIDKNMQSKSYKSFPFKLCVPFKDIVVCHLFCSISHQFL